MNARGAERAPVEAVEASAFSIPTDAPESDGTLRWDRTTLVLVEIRAGGETGLGYSYTHHTAAAFVRSRLREVLVGHDATSPEGVWQRMIDAVRNIGREGLVGSAISAVDVALWDLRAKRLGLSLADLLGPVREAVPVYASGGFTSYDDERLAGELDRWVTRGCRAVKMKIGRDPEDDPRRVALARGVIGDEVELFVDANGAFAPAAALRAARALDEHGVTWFEEPVPSDDHAGLRRVRAAAPLGMAIAAGEYGWDPWRLGALLAAEAIDVLQPDATRCLGITGFLKVAAMAEARDIPISSHCAPALHVPLACAVRHLVHLEYFHDHQRIERALFDGAPELVDGCLAPDRARPGLGLTLRRADAERYRVA